MYSVALVTAPTELKNFAILVQTLARNLTYIKLLVSNVLHRMLLFRYVGRSKHLSRLEILCNVS
jgi:hypothetical protein